MGPQGRAYIGEKQLGWTNGQLLDGWSDGGAERVMRDGRTKIEGEIMGANSSCCDRFVHNHWRRAPEKAKAYSHASNS